VTTNFFDTDDEDDYKPWTLADIYADLGSRIDICKALDVSRYRVNKWILRRERIKAPIPLNRVGNVDVYSVQEWKDWFKDWLNPGRRGRRANSKWVDAKTHGAGQNFFTYGTTCPTCGNRSDDL
jgi:hypothetical protein